MDLFFLLRLTPTRASVENSSLFRIKAVLCLSNPLSLERSLLILQVLGRRDSAAARLLTPHWLQS